MAAISGVEKLIYPFLVVYGISYFFTEFGPNATTFVYPAELFPVAGRTTGHGVVLGRPANSAASSAFSCFRSC